MQQIYGCPKDSYGGVFPIDREPSHVHIIIGSNKDKLEDIVRDMKKHTSSTLKVAIKNNNSESRKEWMIWMFERAGKKNGNNKDWQFWQQPQLSFETLNYKELLSVCLGLRTMW
ncbi:MAG: hypothetical protein M3R50_11750 [Bacteroidota bacterium]|nr:hypothetical protein [Bacteroidota bacterium]